MYLKDYLNKYNDKKIKLFVDMDGVIADYDFGNTANYDKKRPLFDSIKKLEEISTYPNIELYILSVTKLEKNYEEKNWWLDKYAPFFKKENRTIIVKEKKCLDSSSSLLKANYLKELEKDESIIILIDDDPRVLKSVREKCEDIILLKDSVLVD